jgi:hypothetical protein
LADRKFRLTKQGKKSADQATNIRPSNPAARVTGQRRKLTRHTMEGF